MPNIPLHQQFLKIISSLERSQGRQVNVKHIRTYLLTLNESRVEMGLSGETKESNERKKRQEKGRWRTDGRDVQDIIYTRKER